MTESAVEVRNLTKKFGDLTAVKDVNFEIEKGEFFSLLGPSGCGKTTTLRLIAGFESPTAGEIRIGSKDVTDKPPNKRDTGMVFQGYSLFPHKSVGENIAFGLKMRGVEPDKRRERVDEILQIVDLPGFEDRTPDELSGGQQQRVALARALIIEPTVLLLDEPLAALDLKLRKRMRTEIKQIHNQYDITTIYVTHDQEEALEMSDRILVMDNGEPQQISSPIELYNAPNNRFVADFIGETNLTEVEVTAVAGKIEVELPSGEVMSVSKEQANTDNIREGDQVLLNIRPEDLDVQHEPITGKNIQGTIKTRTFIGQTTKLVVDVGGWELLVGVSGNRAKEFEMDQKVYITWDDEGAMLVGDS